LRRWKIGAGRRLVEPASPAWLGEGIRLKIGAIGDRTACLEGWARC